MGLIDADLLSDKIRENKELLQKGLGKDAEFALMTADSVLKLVENQPPAYDVDAVIAQIKERTAFLSDCTKYGNTTKEQQEKSYDTMMMYEVADLIDDLIEIVKDGGIKSES